MKKSNCCSAIILFLLSALSLSCKKDAPEMMVDIPILDHCPMGIYNGVSISYQNSRTEVDELSADNVHIWFHWDFIEPVLASNFVIKDQVTELMIEEYSAGIRSGIDWALTDDYIDDFKDLTLVAGIGSGWTVDMPLLNDEKITPNSIGRENYLGQLYLYTRATVRRYADVVAGWQIENEPNIYSESVLFGIREGALWNDVDFVTEVLEVLEEAVRAEDPTAWVTINFHTDLHYENDILRWIDLIDVIGIDAYPNFFTGLPIMSDVVIDRLIRAKSLSGDKPVILMETGYASFPVTDGFSESNQAQYIEEVYQGLTANNICGGFYFKLSTSEKAPAQTSIEYMGLIRADGSYKPSWFSLQEAIQ